MEIQLLLPEIQDNIWKLYDELKYKELVLEWKNICIDYSPTRSLLNPTIPCYCFRYNFLNEEEEQLCVYYRYQNNIWLHSNTIRI